MHVETAKNLTTNGHFCISKYIYSFAYPQKAVCSSSGGLNKFMNDYLKHNRLKFELCLSKLLQDM